MSSFGPGVRLALTTLTVLPLRPGAVDRRIAAVAMSLAPMVGLLLGCLLATLGWLLSWLGLSSFAGAAAVAASLVLLTRGLHLDGLADTVDALGSYRGRERALEIMKSAEVGPMGVAAIVVVLVIETAALTSLIDHHGWAAIAVAVAVGRFAITLGCRRGVPAARPDGLGSFVAGTVAPGICIGWGVGLLGAMTVASDDHWPGVAAVLIAVAATLVVLAHVRRRLGGITGDVLGAVCEFSTAIALLTVSAH